MVESNDVFIGINDLLKDLCQFIEKILINLPPSYRDEAQKLVQQTKKKISVITPIYTDMNKGKFTTVATDEYVKTDFVEVIKEDVYQDNYDIPENQPVAISKSGEICPHNELPSYLLKDNSVKYGPLLRYERFIFDMYKKCFAGQVDNWLLIYNQPPDEKASKPFCSINVSEYNLSYGEKTPVKQLDKRVCSFQLIEIHGKKNYLFVARTSKEMEQWVAVLGSIINTTSYSNSTAKIQSKKTGATEIRQLPPTPPKNESKYRDFDLNDKEDYEYQPINADDIYHDIGYGKSVATNESEPTYDESEPTYDESEPACNTSEHIYDLGEHTYDLNETTYDESEPTYDESEPYYNEPTYDDIESLKQQITEFKENNQQEITDEHADAHLFRLKKKSSFSKNVPLPNNKKKLLNSSFTKPNQILADSNIWSSSTKEHNVKYVITNKQRVNVLSKSRTYQVNDTKDFDETMQDFYETVDQIEPHRTQEEKSAFTSFLHRTKT